MNVSDLFELEFDILFHTQKVFKPKFVLDICSFYIMCYGYHLTLCTNDLLRLKKALTFNFILRLRFRIILYWFPGVNMYHTVYCPNIKLHLFRKEIHVLNFYKRIPYVCALLIYACIVLINKYIYLKLKRLITLDAKKLNSN